MNHIEALNSDILEVTMDIRERFPELYDLLDEMTVTIPNIKNPVINIETLDSYYNSLRSMLNTYNNKDHRLSLL